jgi:flagellar protein FliT
MTADMEPDALRAYEAMAEVSGRMLGAARESDWDRFIAEEKRCRELVAELQARAEANLSAAERARKFVLLRKMLADDAEIRNLADPWMQHLQDMLASSGNNRRLGESYGSQP